MEFRLDAACASNIGKIRKNNEDNILFFNKTLPENNRGLRNPNTGETTISEPMCLAVFDGMGGEDYGEIAAFTAAQTLKEELLLQSEFLVPEKQRLTDLCSAMNLAVVRQAQKLRTNRMGTTVAMLYFLPRRVYVCNLGDSRAYRLRAGEFMQLSEDHTESSALAENTSPQKTPLTQYLGIAPDEMVLNPHIAKGGDSSGRCLFAVQRRFNGYAVKL